MSVTYMWAGALTSTSIRVRAKVTGTGARLAISTSPDLSSPTFHETVVVGSSQWVDLTATGLTPGTPYWFGIEDTGVLDTTTKGSFTTAGAEGEPESYRAAASSCALGTNTPGPGATSNHAVFDTIRNHTPAFFCHLGDIAYPNITTNDVTLYRQMYEDVLANARQHQLYRNAPIVYTWDDHDVANNNSDRTDPGIPAAAQVYRERVPSYTLPDSANRGCWQAFKRGRVLWLASDTRSYRDPNSDPDGPSKTMLGGAQKAWLENILATSDAEALVWLNPTPWMGFADDTWSGFATERDELVDMFAQHGWLDRMVCLNGDYHGLAMDSGGGNSWGGFPVAIFGSMDSLDVDNAGTPTHQYDLGPTSPGPDRYGLIDVDDNGDRIIITLTAYIGDSLWNTTSINVATVAEEPPPPGEEEPPPGPPPPVRHSVATPALRVTWFGCDLITGRIIAELPDITGNISRVLGAYTSSELTLPIPRAPEIALQATEKARTMIVAVVNNVPTWAGIVLARSGGTGATLKLGCVSLEGYLDRRHVADNEWIQRDEASVIGAGLAADAQIEGIGLTIDAPATGTKRDRTYVATDAATVYSRLRELMGVIDGPEWTIDVDWEDDNDRTVVTKTLRIRSRIGIESATPNAIFSSKNTSEATYEFLEDYTDGKGANHVIATGSGEGDDQPTSAPTTDIRPGWPRYERRFTPSTSISDTAVLNAHAASELALRLFGSNVYKIEARWDAVPRLNVDWRLGDDVAWDLVGHRHPTGTTGIGRVIGWELDTQTGKIRPILYDPSEDEAA